MFEETTNFIIKVTKSCNLRCKYCYIKDKDSEANKFMSFETYKVLIDKIIRDKIKLRNHYKLNNIEAPENVIILTFHGGEPTLLGYENFKKFLSYSAKEFSKHNIAYQFCVQTNYTLLNDDLMTLFHQYKVNIGISFDGLGDSNSLRFNKSLRYFKDRLNYINKYLRPGVLTVINKHNYKQYIKNGNYLHRLDINGLKGNYVEDTQNLGDIEISGDEYLKYVFIPYMKRYVKGTLKFEDQNISAILAKSFYRYISNKTDLKNEKGFCYIKFCGAACRILEIDPDGTINKCGRYSSTSEYSKVGSIFEDSFLNLDIISSYLGEIRRKHEVIMKLGCDSCIAKDICDHGCMAFCKEKTSEYGIRSELVCPIFTSVAKYIAANYKKIFRAYMMNTPSFSFTVDETESNQDIKDRIHRLDKNVHIKKYIREKEEVQVEVEF